MKNPSHPGRLIKGELDGLGASVAEAASALGVTRQQLYRLIRGEQGISPEMALRLEKAIGGGADMWLRMQSNHDLARARENAQSLQVTRLAPKAA
ncbi:MAG: HigA family addiction module antitoxin [Rhizobiaceae bacterium]